MSTVRAVVSDFGGVLTSPMFESFAFVQEESGIALPALGSALARIAHREGANPLYELEKGRMTEARFLETLAEELRSDLGREVTLHGFGERIFSRLAPNEPMIAFMRELGARGVRLALLTNNVREWEARWRSMLPVDDLFEVVVDSAFVGMRKPEPEIYELTLERLGLGAEACVFVDDLEPNVAAARDLGMHAVLFETNDQAIAQIEAVLEG